MRFLPFLGIALGACALAQAPVAVKLPDLSKAKDPYIKSSAPPVIAESVTRQTFARFLIQVQWRKGDPVNIYLIRPLNTVRPPVSVFLYGFPSDLKRYEDDNYCRRVTQGGMAVIGMESALTGDRYRSRPMREWFVSELDESFHKTVLDVQYLLDYLTARGDLDMSRVGMFGQGSGASIAVLAAATDPRIKAIDLLNPWADWPTWTKTTASIGAEVRRELTTPKFLARIRPYDPVLWLPRLKKTVIRVQYVRNEPTVPVRSQDAFLRALPAQAVKVTLKDNLELYRATSDGKLFTWLTGTLRR